MGKQIIMRPVYNRPEMLKLSIDYEIAAREAYPFKDDFTTVFVIEHGSPRKTLDLVSSYPYDFKCVFREKKYGLSPNILEGLKQCFNMTEDYVIYIEDDILLHKSFFSYLDVLFNMDLGKYGILASAHGNDNGDVHAVKRIHFYAALAPLITKYFFETYVLPHCSKAYYDNRVQYITKLNDKYKEYQESRRYKYKNAAHNEQAGLINRLCDIAAIEEEMYVIRPEVNRNMHIGYFGKNRPGGIIPGPTFEARVKNLREIIKTPESMYKMSATKQYDDYRVWSDKLNDWDGTLFVRGEE